MFVQSKLELFQIDRLARSYGKKLLGCRKTLQRVQNLICPFITSVCKKKVSLLSRPISGSDEWGDRAVSWLTVESFCMSCSINWMCQSY
jgi:hypothetical protein